MARAKWRLGFLPVAVAVGLGMLGASRRAEADDPGMLEGSLKYAQDFTEKIPLVKREGVQVVLDQETAKNPPPKEFTPERFYDNSLVQELIQEGFYKSLWSK